MLAAKQFFKAGFEIFARPEIGALGEDFDFTAVRAGECANVEVTALTADTFSENTILNALHRKRRQVPNNAPAVIYCVMPEKWFPDPSNWNSRLPMIAEKFLTNTKRINVLVAWTERHVPLGDGPGGGLVILRNSFRNPSPRITTECLDFLFDGTPATTLDSIQSGVGLKELVEEANSSEFFQWVDHLVPIESK
jgi:hypothetical protein